MFEEKEKQTTSLKDLIELVERDSIPTNEFTTEDKDPLVILGKLNEVVAYLESLQATINSSDTKANEALTKAKQAIADATQALDVANGIDAKATQALSNAVNAVATANTALNASNTALNTANTALGTANTALNSSNSAVETANIADTKATNAVNTANSAKNIAEGIDDKATNALTNSNTAINTANSASSTANEAKSTAEDALNRVVAGLGTKVFRGNTLLDNLNIADIEALIAQNTNSINQEATTRANAVKALDDAKVDKVSGKQLSTEDYTTAEKTKLAGLNNYNDTQVKADITALQTRATNIENKNTEQDSSIVNINNKFSSYLKITDLINKIYPIGSIYLSINNVSPSSFIGGTWEQLPANKALWLVNANAGTEILAGLPNITGDFRADRKSDNTVLCGSDPTGAFTWSVNAGGNHSTASRSSTTKNMDIIGFNASLSNSIYGTSTTVQPPAYTIYGWRRIS